MSDARLGSASSRAETRRVMAGCKVLLVEDSPSDARLVIEMLHDARDARFDLARATRLDEALRRLSKGGIDCVLLDMLLPDSMGLDTFRRLKEHAPDIPIVILSGLGDQEVGDQLIEEGAQDHLVKGTFDSRRLETTILNALRRTTTAQAQGPDQQTHEIHLGRDLLRRILDESAVPIMLVDEGGQVQFANQSAADGIGIETGDVQGAVGERLAADNCEDELHWRIDGDDGPVFQFARRRLRVDGRRLWLLTLMRVRDD